LFLGRRRGWRDGTLGFRERGGGRDVFAHPFLDVGDAGFFRLGWNLEILLLAGFRLGGQRHLCDDYLGELLFLALKVDRVAVLLPLAYPADAFHDFLAAVERALDLRLLRLLAADG